MAANSFIDSLNNTAGILAGNVKSRANAALFKSHLADAQSQASNDNDLAAQQAARSASIHNQTRLNGNANTDTMTGSKKLDSSKSAHHSRHGASRAASADPSSNDKSDDSSSDTTTVLNAATVDLTPPALPIGKSGSGGAPATNISAKPEVAAAAKSSSAASGANPTTAVNSDAAALPPDVSNSATSPANQAPAANSDKTFSLLRAAAGTTSPLDSNPATGSAESENTQAPTAALAQSIKVAVQTRAATSSAPTTDNNAIVAQQSANSNADNDPGSESSAQLLPTQNATTETASTTAPEGSGEQSAAAIAGLSGAAEGGGGSHKHEFNGNASSDDNSLQNGPAVPEGSSTAASNAGTRTTFASLVATTTTSGAASASNSVETIAPPAPQVPPPPVEQMVFGISRLANGGNSFSIQLAPERLGSVSVQLEVDAKGKTRATFSAERPETLALIRQDSHQLLKALQDAGVKADQGSLNFSLKDHQSGTANQERRSPSGGSSVPRAAATTATEISSGSADVQPTIASSRLYDLQA